MAFSFFTAFIQDEDEAKNEKYTNVIPDKETAIKIAEAIWLPAFGKKIYNYKPFKAKLISDSIWYVSGTVPTKLGGGPILRINKNTCFVYKISHEK